MGMFGKRGADIDFTEMQRRGLIKKQPIQESDNVKVNSQGFVEFGQNTNNSISNSLPSTANESASPFGFFDTFASNAGATATSTDITPVVSQASTAPDFANLGFQVENLDYKLGVLAERLEKIESKLIEFENKTQGFRL
jgi:hypothetical protein